MPIDDSSSRIAVFDFCETVADFQTATAFVDYVRENSKKTSVRLWHALYVIMLKSQLIRIMDGLTGHRYSISKHIKLWQLRGLAQEQIQTIAERFYNERVEPHLIKVVVSKMQNLQREGYKVGLSSGGYGVYLKFFVEKYGLDFCHCSEIQFRNERCMGKMEGKDCMREEKTRRLNRSFGPSPTGSVAFSDSESDLPLLLWADKGVVVSRGFHQKWIEKYKFIEIIW